MKITKTKIKDLLIIEPTLFGDDRGYFLESFNKKTYNKIGICNDFVQDNESKSTFGVLRGLHFQKPPFEQAKLVRCIDGEVLDIALDIRTNSKTYGQHVSLILSGDNKKQFYIPRGFAHGFVVLSKSATFSYKVDNYYSPNHDCGIIWNDADLNIDWMLSNTKPIVSKKDLCLLTFNKTISPFK
jgi:dTDP-4-dehydrorhamnose 3,5-epimerase